MNFYKYETVSDFISENMHKFEGEVLNWLIQFASSNKCSSLFWGNFPPEYQVKYLSSLNFSDALSSLDSYKCELLDDEKQAVMRDILKVKSEE